MSSDAVSGLILEAPAGLEEYPRDVPVAPGKTAKLFDAAIGRDFKGKISVVLYAAAVPLAFVHVLISIAIYNLVAILWIVPDPRIEKTLER